MPFRSWLGIHGDQDTIVPYRNALTIQQQAEKVGLLNTLITVKGGGHVPMDQLLDSAQEYLGQFTSFLAQAMNATAVECPRR